MNNIINHNTIIVNEKVTFRCNQYTLYDEDQRVIGHVRESQSFWRYIVNRQLLPTTMNLFDENDRLVVSVHRGSSFLLPKVNILDPEGNLLAHLKSKLKLLKQEIEVYLPTSEQYVARILGDLIAWEFKIVDNNEQILGTVSKKWNGALKVLFTTADKYVVSIDPSLSDPTLRTIVIATAVVVDSIFKEKN